MKNIYKLNQSLFILLLLISGSKTFSQYTFVKRAGSSHSDFGVAIQPTIDRGIILAATTSTNGMDVHTALTKTDSNGTFLWAKLFMTGQWSVPQSVLQSNDEGFITYGTASDSFALNVNNYRLFLHKTGLFGNPQWDKSYRITTCDLGVNLIRRKLGGYIACSVGNYNIGYPNTVITQIDFSGNVVWSKQFTSIYGLTPQKVIELANGSICFIAYSGDYSASPFNDIVVTLLDATGNILWTKNIGTYYDDEPNAVASNSSSEIFITGRSYFMTREWDTFMIRLDTAGNILHSDFYDGGTYQGEIMRCIVARDDGSSILLGDMGTFNERDIAFIKLDNNSQVVSAKRYLFSPMFTNYPYEMYETHDGGFVFTGDIRPPSALRDAVIAKADSNGDVYCFNSNAVYTAHQDSIHFSNITLNANNAVVTVLTDSSTVPNNTFLGHIDCAGPLSVDNIHRSNLQLYPNPAFNHLKISGEEPIESISIYNMEGKLILKEENIRSQIYFADINSLASGMYVVECNFNSTIKRLRFIKNQ